MSCILSNLAVLAQVFNPSYPSGFQALLRMFFWDIESASVIYSQGRLSVSLGKNTVLSLSYGFVSDSCAFFHSLTQFFDRAREMEFFKSVIQIPDLPDVSFWKCFHAYISVQMFGISCYKSSHFIFYPTGSSKLPPGRRLG